MKISVGCVIVDSKSGRVLSESYDKRTSSKHPLKHAVLNCINELSMLEKMSGKTAPENNDDKKSERDFIIPSKRKVEDDDQADDTYLCKGYDIFVTHEPCIMYDSKKKKK